MELDRESAALEALDRSAGYIADASGRFLPGNHIRECLKDIRQRGQLADNDINDLDDRSE